MPVWGAGTPKMFGWQDDGFGRMGVGIREDLLHKNDNLFIEFENGGSVKSVEVDCKRAIELSEMYNAYKFLMGGIKVLIFPVFAFDVNKESREDKKTRKTKSRPKKYPLLSFSEMSALRGFFKAIGKEKAIEIGKKTSEEHWEYLRKGMTTKDFSDNDSLKKADKLAKKINFWRKLYKEKYVNEKI